MSYAAILQRIAELADEAEPGRIRFARMSSEYGPDSSPSAHGERWPDLPTPHMEWRSMLHCVLTGAVEGPAADALGSEWVSHIDGLLGGSWRCGALPVQFPFWWTEADCKRAMHGRWTNCRLFVLEADAGQIQWFPSQIIYNPKRVHVIEELFIQ